MQNTDRSRRQLLIAGTGVGTSLFAGCLEITSEQPATEADQQPPASEQSTPSDDESADEDSSDVISCRTDSLPTETTDGTEQTFLNPRNQSSSEAAIPEEQPCLAWHHQVDAQTNRLFSEPLVTPETIVLKPASDIVGRSREDGTVVWRASETLVDQYRGLRPLGTFDSHLIMYGRNRRNDSLYIITVDPATGDRQWRLEVVSQSDPNANRFSAGQLNAPRLYVSIKGREPDGTRLFCIDTAEQSILWERTVADVSLQLEDMATDGEQLIATTDEAPEDTDNVWAFDTADGEVLWSRQIPIGEGIPVLDDTNLYLPVESHGSDAYDTDIIEAISKRDGATNWEFETMNSPRTGVSADDERVYVVADGQLYALSPATGEPEWRVTTNDDTALRGNSEGLPIVFSDWLLIGSRSNEEETAPKIRAIDKRSGTVGWSFGVSAETIQSPLLADGVLYTMAETASNETKLYAFG